MIYQMDTRMTRHSKNHWNDISFKRILERNDILAWLWTTCTF